MQNMQNIQFNMQQYVTQYALYMHKNMPNNSTQCIMGIFCKSQYAAYAKYVIQYAAVYQEI